MGWRAHSGKACAGAGTVTDTQLQWSHSRDALIRCLASLGFPIELGEMMARHLGSPKAIDRLTAYLGCAEPTDINMVVDEMLAIRAEIDAWKEKKESMKADMAYNELLWYGLE